MWAARPVASTIDPSPGVREGMENPLNSGVAPEEASNSTLLEEGSYV
jgi:hypothetical protein